MKDKYKFATGSIENDAKNIALEFHRFFVEGLSKNKDDIKAASAFAENAIHHVLTYAHADAKEKYGEEETSNEYMRNLIKELSTNGIKKLLPENLQELKLQYPEIKYQDWVDSLEGMAQSRSSIGPKDHYGVAQAGFAAQIAARRDQVDPASASAAVPAAAPPAAASAPIPTVAVEVTPSPAPIATATVPAAAAPPAPSALETAASAVRSVAGYFGSFFSTTPPAVPTAVATKAAPPAAVEKAPVSRDGSLAEVGRDVARAAAAVAAARNQRREELSPPPSSSPKGKSDKGNRL